MGVSCHIKWSQPNNLRENALDFLGAQSHIGGFGETVIQRRIIRDKMEPVQPIY